jgi:hypothetical protein
MERVELWFRIGAIPTQEMNIEAKRFNFPFWDWVPELFGCGRCMQKSDTKNLIVMIERLCFSTGCE